jgi:hypothetical protein
MVKIKISLLVSILFFLSFNILFGQYQLPPTIKGAVTASGTVTLKGLADIDGRDHDINGNLLSSPTDGILGVWTTSTLVKAGNPKVGGTVDCIDYPLSIPPNVATLTEQTYPGGFPSTPDSVLGLPEGTLKLPYAPVVAYYDSSILLNSTVYPDGILIVHNATKNAVLQLGADFTFKGIVIADNLTMTGLSKIIGTALVIGPTNSGQGKFSAATGAPQVLFSLTAVNNAYIPILCIGAISISPPSLTNARKNIPYNQSISADGEYPPFRYYSSTLPTGITLSTDGILSGTPTSAGKYSFWVQVRDSLGCTSSKTYSLTVDPPGTIQGSQFWDMNKNGIKDAGESGLPTWKIRLYGTIDDSTVTDTSGNYAFNNLPIGNYLVAPDFRTSWSQSYPASLWNDFDSLKERGRIQIFKHLVALAQDAYTYRITPVSQGGGGGSYSGYVIPSSLTVNPYATFTRYINNGYSIKLYGTSSFISPGTFSVTCDSIGLFSSATTFSQRMWQIRISPRDTLFNAKDFGNIPFEIRGKVFTDYKDSNLGLSGFRVNLRGSIDTFAITDANGDFVLRDFPWGTYVLTQDSNAEWSQSYPSPIPTPCESNYAMTMAMQRHLRQIGGLAWYYRMTPSDYGGGSGSYIGFAIPAIDQSDSIATYGIGTISRQVIYLTAQLLDNPAASITMSIDSVGAVSSMVHSSILYPRQEPGSQFIDVHNIWEYGIIGAVYRNFGNTQPTTIRGLIFSDDNRNGVRDTGEGGIADYKVFVGGSVIDSATTDSSGFHTVTNLPAGYYFVNEGYHTGQGQTSPSVFPFSQNRDSLIENFNHLIKQLHILAADAYRYKTLSFSWGGGGGTYLSYTIPGPIYSLDDGTFMISTAGSAVSIGFTATSIMNHGTITAYADSVGKLDHFALTGDFASLGFRFVDTDSLSRDISDVNFGNTRLPNAPIFTGILPTSPSNNNTPVISGHAETFTTIKIYADDCNGVLVATTSADSTGAFETIVSVPDNSTTIFYATATNIIGTSPCSLVGIEYREDSQIPSAPAGLTIVPDPPSANNHPTISGVAESRSFVRIYTDTTGSTPIATTFADSVGVFSAPLTVPNNSTTTFYATASDSAGNVSEWSSGITYTQDSRSPSAPDSITIYPTSERVALHWAANSEPDILRYRIYSDTVPHPTTLIDSTEKSVTTKLVFGLKRGIQYHFRLTAIDSCLNESDYSNEVDNNSMVRFEIENGWNMISLPVQYSDNRNESVFPEATSKAFAYYGSYATVDTILAGRGYWLKFEDAQIKYIDGPPIGTDTIAVVKGWNMIGSFSQQTSLLNIFSQPPGIITSNFYCYNTGYDAVDTLGMGKGYWVKVDQTGFLFISSSLLSISKTRIQIIPSSDLPPPPPTQDLEFVELPKEYHLEGNYPNPFNPSTIIRYQIPRQCFVSLKVYDMLGRQVATLVENIQDAGHKSFEWNAIGVSSGMYLYHLQCGNYSAIKKMMVVK